MKFEALVDDLLATLRDADGVGIAAPQVFESRRCSSLLRARIRVIPTPPRWSRKS